MAVDTIKIRSHYISEELAEIIQKECTMRIGYDLKTDVLLYQITTGSLQGSYDSRISITVKRQEWKTSKAVNGKVYTCLVDCPPYLEIECSLHKLFLGHNIFGGSEDFQSCVFYLIRFLERQLGVTLPVYSDWLVKRIDFAYVFDLGSFSAVQEFFYLMKNAYYPRRSVDHHGLHGLYASASTTALKFYHKGKEFKKHDFRRLVSSGFLSENEAFSLLSYANRILRVEVEIKTKKLKYDFQKLRYGHEPYVKDITSEYLISVYETEVDRFMKEGKNSSDKVRSMLEVESRLYSMYRSDLASRLFGAWIRISALGIDKYKEAVPRRTFYRHIKQLKDAGISWNRSDVIEDTEKVKVPRDFQPLRNDIRRISFVDDKIKGLLDEAYFEMMGLESLDKKEKVKINAMSI